MSELSTKCGPESLLCAYLPVLLDTSLKSEDRQRSTILGVLEHALLDIFNERNESDTAL